MRRLLFATSTLLSTIIRPASCQQHDNCDVASYYSTITDLANDRDQLHTHIKNTHQVSLVYSEVWDALASLDSDVSGESILLVYGDRYVPTVPHDQGSCEYWNREHLWPRSRGVGETGHDNTDLHHIRASDCNVNSARGNLFFGSCSLSFLECTMPAHSEAAIDTEKTSTSFLPPANQRGDVARAIFYMDLRYDGDETNVEDLFVTDCPEGITRSMGYLSQLLQWHADDPPDELEKKRNDSICKSKKLPHSQSARIEIPRY